MSKFGLLIKDLNNHRHGASIIKFLYVGMFRKLWLVLMLVFMQKYVFWSLIMVNFQAVMMVLIVGSVKPF